MGLIALEINIIDYYIDYYKKITNTNNIDLLELGDQIFYKNHPTVGILDSNFQFEIAKDYYESKGINHTSIDFNGQNRSIPFDLSQPLPEEFHNKFDIITNVGTIEHVENDQYTAFKNVHMCLKTNGLFMSFMPKVDNFDHSHCPWFYNMDFFKNLSGELNYTIHHIGELLYPNLDMGILITCVLQKNENKDFDIINKDIFYQNLFKNTKPYNSY